MAEILRGKEMKCGIADSECWIRDTGFCEMDTESRQFDAYFP
jgi:hypothetical protein